MDERELGYYWIRRNGSDYWFIAELREYSWSKTRYFSGVNIGGVYDNIAETIYIQPPRIK